MYVCYRLAWKTRFSEGLPCLLQAFKSGLLKRHVFLHQLQVRVWTAHSSLSCFFFFLNSTLAWFSKESYMTDPLRPAGWIHEDPLQITLVLSSMEPNFTVNHRLTHQIEGSRDVNFPSWSWNQPIVGQSFVTLF